MNRRDPRDGVDVATLHPALSVSKFAVVGKFLKLRYEDGWEVISAGHTLPSDYVRDHERDYKDAFASLQV